MQNPKKTRVAFAYHFNDKDWFGGKNYFTSLFSAIAKNPPNNIEFLFVTGLKVETTLPQDFPWMKVVQTKLLDKLSPPWLLRKVTTEFLNKDYLLIDFLKKNDIDILSHSGHLGKQKEIKVIDWLYDFQFIHLPDYWKPLHVKRTTDSYIAKCKNSDALIVSSHDALADLKKFAPWSQVPHHVLQFVSRPMDYEKILSKEEVLKKYNLPNKYFYLPNQFWMNKNHSLAIDALALLKEDNNDNDIVVVCTGKEFDARQPKYFGELMQYVSEKNVSDVFKVLGIIPYEDTQALMTYSCGVINPSRFEGWSTTVEEAKSLQCRLLLSDIPVHREQANELGVFFDNNNPKQLAALIKQFYDIDEPVTSTENKILNYDQRLLDFRDKYIQAITNL